MTASRLLLVICLGAVASFPATAQQYPAKPIRIIVPFAPGGGVDFVSRFIGQKLAEPLGQIVVDNRPGAGGTIGAEIGVKSLPDGYTLTMISLSYPVTATLYKLPYDPVADISPIVMVATTPYFLVVHPSLPVHTVKELVSLAKAKPDRINFASSGVGGGVHLAMELFMYEARIKLHHVPYKGTGQAVIDTVAGHVSMQFGTVSPLLPHIKANRLRPLGVTSSERLGSMPSIPTIAESGLPNYEVIDWTALIGPKGTPPRVVDRINKDVADVLALADVKARLQNEGLSPGGGTPEQLMEVVRKDIDKWRKVITAAGLKVN